MKILVGVLAACLLATPAFAQGNDAAAKPPATEAEAAEPTEAPAGTTPDKPADPGPEPATAPEGTAPDKPAGDAAPQR